MNELSQVFWCYDDVLWNEMNVWMNMFVIVIEDEKKEIKNQRHFYIPHQMKVVNVGLQPNKLKQVECMVVNGLVRNSVTSKNDSSE